ncbi:HNH endonuclease [Patulibacter americanus]|uniref:HNH endonuclease n=1 Tax=Patulibacter americanus TaxID=588672 RepID=UPI0003B5DFC3|nr:HNH endonuclease [Patulibacter americanus]
MAVTVEMLLERDGPACAWCGRAPWRRDLTLEHLVPRSRGGHLTPENVVLACGRCNRRRGARPADAYVRELLRDGVAVDVEGLRTALRRLLDADRRVHREAGQRQLERLRSVDAPVRP